MTLSDALKRLRKAKNASQVKAANAAGVSTTQYQNYEYGKSEPTASVLIALADYFQVSLDYLVGRSDCPDILCYDKNGNPVIIECMRPIDKEVNR